MFQLTREESENLRFQIETPMSRVGVSYLPYAFTEQGVGRLNVVLLRQSGISFPNGTIYKPGQAY